MFSININCKYLEGNYRELEKPMENNYNKILLYRTIVLDKKKFVTDLTRKYADLKKPIKGKAHLTQKDMGLKKCLALYGLYQPDIFMFNNLTILTTNIISK